MPPSGVITGLTDDSACNTYIPIAPAASSDVNQSALQLFYAKNTCPGARKIDIITTSSVGAVAWEVSGIRTDDPFDTALGLSNQLSTPTPAGPRIITSTAGEFVVSVAIVESTITGIVAGNEFTNDHIVNGDAWAHLGDPMAPAGPHQAHWNQLVSGTYCASAAAFKVGP
jgi:hypothetical protein